MICPRIGEIFLEDESEEDWEFVLGINLTGVMHCMRAQIKLGGMGKGGAIVNASSVAGLQGRVTAGSYVASKHGVIGLTKTMAKEVGPKGVRVNCIAPCVYFALYSPCFGRVRSGQFWGIRKNQELTVRLHRGVISTPMVANVSVAGGVLEESEEIQRSPLGRSGQPEEVAKLIAFLLSDDSSYITGAVHTIDGGLIC